MMKNLSHDYLKLLKINGLLFLNRPISCSAIKNEESLSQDISKRYFPESLREDFNTKEINIHRLINLLDGNNIKIKNSLRKILCDEIMKPRYDISLEEERNLTHFRLKHLCDAGFISAYNVAEDPKSVFATHELAAVVDPAMAFKMNAQFNWFAGTLLKLGGNMNYSKILPNIDNLSATGCFALTELGFGNGRREIETTAIYDHDTQELIIDTPNPLAQKYWVTNAAFRAKYMIVFARLYVKSSFVGVHGMLVQIRDDNLKVLPNVHIEDMGHKMGVNGIDAAKVSFETVRIPKENLLNKYCDITPDGEYVSKFKRDDQKFFVMSDELLTGKISIASMCSGAAKASIAIAIRYAASRLVPGPDGKDVTILEYPLHQRALIPLLARVYGLQFIVNYVANRYSHQPADGSHHTTIVTLSCAIKALLSWNLEKVVTVCREKCGGQGMLSCNRFGTFLGLAHSAISAEGDNSVLMQKVVRQRLAGFTPRSISSPVRDFSTTKFLFDLMNKKENLLYLELHNKIYEAGKEKAYDVWVLEEAELVQSCGMAFIERAVSEEMMTVAERAGSKERIILSAINRLYILNILERDLDQIMSNGIVSMDEVNDIKYESKKLCQYLSRCALELVDAFDLPQEMLSAPVAHDWIAYNVGDKKGEVS